MYSEDYNEEFEDDDDESISKENFFVTFYRNNKILVWILLGIILFILLMSILTKGGSNKKDEDDSNKYKVTIEPSGDVVIAIGRSEHLNAKVDGDASPTIKWTVDDPMVATVDEGTVKAINYGTTTVTATYIDKNKDPHKDDKTIIVGEGNKDVVLTDVSFKTGDLFMPISSKYTVSLILTPSNAFISNLKFTSSNTKVVTVDNKGEIKSIGSGEAIVSYSVNNGAFRGDLKVYVDPSYTFAEIINIPTKISFDGVLRKIKIGETDQLTYTVEPRDAARSKFTWSSSDTSIVKVDQTGMITGVKEGTAVITVSSINDVSAKIDVEVLKNIVEVSDIDLDTSDMSIDEVVDAVNKIIDQKLAEKKNG